jgi:predicted nucleic acid-binding protein
MYATAKAEKAWLWTQDEHFEKLSGVKYVKSSQKKRG